VQTGKTRRIPIILVGTEFWAPLVDWFRDTLVTAGTISIEDLDLFLILDKPEQVVDAIFSHYEGRGFNPSMEEREVLLQL
jgi:predicted Rossmann-fold nucleotide-binding protein